MKASLGVPSARSRRRVLALAAASLLLLAAFAALWMWPSSGGAGYAFEPGTEYRYRIEYESDNKVIAGGKAAASQTLLESSTRLEADLALRAYEVTGKGWQLGLAITDVKAGALTASAMGLNADAEALEAMLVGRELLFECDRTGRVQDLSMDATTPALASGLLRSLLASLEFVVEPGQSSWQATQDSPMGRALQRYQRDRSGGLGRRLDKYEQVSGLTTNGVSPLGRTEGSAMAVLASAGHLRSLETEEALSLRGDGPTSELTARSRFTAVFVDRAAISAQMRSGLALRRSAMVARSLGGWEEPGKEHTQLSLKRRAAGMTPASMLADLKTYGGRRMPFHSEWVWRATGSLRLYSEAASQLTARFLEADCSPDERLTIIDLLVAASVPSTEAALLEVLTTKEAQALPEYADYLHRLGQQAGLTTATTSMLLLTHARGDSFGERQGAVRHAAAGALGQAASKLLEAGDGETADSIAASLRGWLDSASTSEDEAAYLLAVGNTQMEELVPALASRADKADPAVRRAAAVALSHIESPEAEAALARMVSDADHQVQYQSIVGLSKQERSASAIASLAQALSANQVGSSSVSMAASLLLQTVRQGGPGDHAARSALHVLSQTDISPQLRHEIFSVL